MTGFESKRPRSAEVALEWLVAQASLIGCWEQLREHLERQGRDLRGMAAIDPPRPHSLEWLESVHAFLVRSEPLEGDELEIALRARLRALVAAALSVEKR